MTETRTNSVEFSHRLLVVLGLGPLLLAACLGSDPPDPGLVRAPGFADQSGRLAGPWHFTHHASSDSYRLTLGEGTASIERIGHEPWSRLVQEIDRQALQAVAGRRMAFSVDIRARLDNAGYARQIEPTGLMVRLWQDSQGTNSMLNAMVAPARPRIERLGLAPDALIADWQRHSVEFDVPQDVSRLEISAILASGGLLELRNPSLRVIDG